MIIVNKHTEKIYNLIETNKKNYFLSSDSEEIKNFIQKTEQKILESNEYSTPFGSIALVEKISDNGDKIFYPEVYIQDTKIPYIVKPKPDTLPVFAKDEDDKWKLLKNGLPHWTDSKSSAFLMGASLAAMNLPVTQTMNLQPIESVNLSSINTFSQETYSLLSLSMKDNTKNFLYLDNFVNISLKKLTAYFNRAIEKDQSEKYDSLKQDITLGNTAKLTSLIVDTLKENNHSNQEVLIYIEAIETRAIKKLNDYAQNKIKTQINSQNNDIRTAILKADTEKITRTFIKTLEGAGHSAKEIKY